MYEDSYEKSSRYVIAAGMLLGATPLLYANDNPVQVDEGVKDTIQEQEHIGDSIKADEDTSARHPSGWKVIERL